MSYSKSELLGAIFELGSRVDNETPTATQMNEHDDLPYVSTYRRRFGSWNSALEAAGYEPNLEMERWGGVESPNQYYQRVKREMACSACGESDFPCIEFHHLHEKSFAVSRVPHLAVAPQDVYEEFQKCVPLCANCHKRHHSSEYPFDASEYNVPDYPKPELES